jgi:hypothetical protein
VRPDYQRRFVWEPFVAFVLLVAVVSVGLYFDGKRRSNSLYDQQVAACERGNALRAESNDRVADNEAIKSGLVTFLDGAIRARRASGGPEDIEAARTYEAVRDKVTQVTYERVELVNCRVAIEKP